jgi:hypothetical protein
MDRPCLKQTKRFLHLNDNLIDFHSEYLTLKLLLTNYTKFLLSADLSLLEEKA